MLQTTADVAWTDRPQDENLDGSGLTIEAYEHDELCFPQVLKIADGDGRSCLFVPIRQRLRRFKRQWSPMHESILQAAKEACGGTRPVIVGKVLARLAGYPYNSRFRQALADLVRAGPLNRGPDGYSKSTDAADVDGSECSKFTTPLTDDGAARWTYTFSIFPADNCPLHRSVFRLFEHLKRRVNMTMSEPEFTEFRAILTSYGFTMREITRVPHFEPESVE